MRAIIYTRFSSDRQRQTSTEDQARLCRQFAEREGWTVAAIYSDERISGTYPLAARPGGSRLMADVTADRAEVVIVESLDRLCRDLAEQETIIPIIEHRSIRIVGISDGYDSQQTASARKMTRGMRGIINSIYLDDLAEKTRRGLLGQCERGRHTGGKTYGYRSIPDGDSVRLEIDPDQAATVRDIYRQFADGRSIQAITYELNRRRVPPPRGSSWCVSALYGSPAKGTGIINNEMYAGRLIWNRSQWVRDPQTKRRIRVERPPHEWRTATREDLRIVPDDLWIAARNRMNATRMDGGTKGRGGRPTSLLGGLLTCAHCGGAVIAASARVYGCAARKDRGPSVCAGVLVPRDAMDSAILDIVRNDLTSPAALAEFHRTIKTLAARESACSKTEQTETRKRMTEIESEIGNLVAAIATIGLSPALQQRLTEAEKEKADLQRKSAPRPTAINTDAALARYKEKIRRLDESLKSNPTEARAILRGYFPRIEIEKTGADIYATIRENTAALLADGTFGAFLEVVAGDCYTNQRRILVWSKPTK